MADAGEYGRVGRAAGAAPGPTVAAGFPVVGIIGGGQLARMCQEAALALGVGLRVLAASESESAARGARDVAWGAHDDPAAVAAFATGCQVVTFDHEHVPPAILADLVASGVAVRPGPAALSHAQDKILMRQAIGEVGVPGPVWREVAVPEDVVGFASQHGWPVVLKVSRGGYDGRGVWVVHGPPEVAAILDRAVLAPGARWLVEEHVAFTQELAAQVARSATGEIVCYPVVRTTQTAGICTEVVAPCPGLPSDRASRAQDVAVRIAKALDVVGMLAVEFFDTGDGVLVNELAMRPHNSGHWSIDAAVTSQFENHLRAVLGLPLGVTDLSTGHVVMVNVLGHRHTDLYPALARVMSADPGVRIHMYGKDVRPGRKLGHVTVLSDDLDDALGRAHRAADVLMGVRT